jgi:hypothetical protein
MRNTYDLTPVYCYSSLTYLADPLPEYKPEIVSPPPMVLRDISYNYVGTADLMSGTIYNPMRHIPYDNRVMDSLPNINYNSTYHLQYGNLITDPCGHILAQMGPGGMIQPPPSIPAPIDYVSGLPSW